MTNNSHQDSLFVELPRCEGFLVQVGIEGMLPQDLIPMARRVVEKVLPGKWNVQLLSRITRDFEILPKIKRNIPINRAWEWTYALRECREVANAEPALVIPGIDPLPEQVFSKPPSRPLSLGRARHRSCSVDNEWSLKLSHVHQAWKLTPQRHGQGKPFGEGIVIAHPDTGYTRHPEIWIGQRVLPARGYNFEENRPDPLDPLTGKSSSHGTSTASVIMSTAGVSRGSGSGAFVSGVAPKAKLVPLRVSDSVVHLSFRNLTKAIHHAVNNRQHVISMSLGGPFNSSALERALQTAINKGLIPMAAAGNVWPWVVYPAKYPEVVAVAACNCDQRPWAKSASGTAVDLTAPGESVWRALTQNNQGGFVVARSSGTSYAVATVAGACALWLSYHGRRCLIDRYGAGNLASVFKELLIRHGINTPTGWDKSKYGAGILNAEKLLQAPLPPMPTAGGIRTLHASPVPTATGLLDDLITYFPGEDPDRVEVVLAKLLHTEIRKLNARLAVIGDELAFHIATNPNFRESISARAARRHKKTRAPSIRRLIDTNDVLLNTASKQLQQFLRNR